MHPVMKVTQINFSNKIKNESPGKSNKVFAYQAYDMISN